MDTFQLDSETRRLIEIDHESLKTVTELRFGTNLANIIREQHNLYLERHSKRPAAGKKQKKDVGSCLVLSYINLI